MRTQAFIAALLLTWVAAPEARAAGLYFSERGVRPLGRGGAFTAGANDLHAIWYNPAGVYDSGSQLLFDAAWLNFSTEYTRRALIQQRDPNTGGVVSEYEQTFPTVDGSSLVVPLPTLAASIQVARDWVIAFGIEAPYSAITTYPRELNGAPSPSRYSLITLDGSLLGIIGAWVAYAPNDMWRVGLGLQALAGSFVGTMMFNACVPDRFFCAPEQPEWDSLTQLDVGPIFAPSGNVGVQFIPQRQWQLGVAFQAPFVIRAPATIRVRLPAASIFERASVEGEAASVAFELPWSLRWGVQYEPIDDLFVEVDGSWEGWSIHDAITVTPEDVVLRDLPGFPNPTPVPDQSIPRNFHDALAIRAGGEYGLGVSEDVKLLFRGGVSYETSAIPAEYMSVLTIDIDKLTLGLGAGIEYDAWRFDLVYAHILGADVEVDPADAASPLLMPLEANVTEPHAVNGGTYSARANVVGVGLRYAFDYQDPAEASPQEASHEDP